MAETTIQCPATTDDEPCGGEIIIEWENPHTVIETGKRFCHYCEQYEDEVDPTAPCPMTNRLEDYTTEELRKMRHKWVVETEDQYGLELVSYKTYCWHSLTRAEAMSALNDEWAAGEERAYEIRMGL